ncbi:iron-sulfur cluster-binding protein-related [Anaeramoeba flamelloides]|uniref:Iron-sulfur cluster-binding protein-related n=1 Tax=Anaeramoeba flamelloides TaxID=1746091 RepID=A0ABQ8Z7N7_9EUKA|nr:iron-sulfur cluster-binding protein-related [Anaeramoeba flamelloides]
MISHLLFRSNTFQQKPNHVLLKSYSSQLDLKYIKGIIKNEIASYKSPIGDDLYREPLVAVASSHDPLFFKLKKIVHDKHLMPNDIVPHAKSVISFFLPFSKKVNKSNKADKILPSELWLKMYTETNHLREIIGIRVAQILEAHNYRSSTITRKQTFDESTLTSQWSHKHVAYIAGLGTFGKNHQIITKSGCVGRLQSVITTLELKPTKRPDHEYCLAKSGRECTACIRACPNSLLNTSEFDKFACYNRLRKNKLYFEKKGNLPKLVCGKCSTNLPCSLKNPI